MVFTLLLVGVVRLANIMQHRFAIQTFVTKPRTHLEYIDKGISFNGLALIQVLISCIVLAFVVYSFVANSNLLSGMDSWRQYLLLMLGVVVVYTLKYAVHHIVGTVLQSDEITQLSVLSIVNMQYAVSLFLFPFMMAWYYMPSDAFKYYVQLGLIVVLIGYWLWRLAKIVFVYYNYFPFSKVYLIFYLCALEISPVLIAWRYALTVA